VASPRRFLNVATDASLLLGSIVAAIFLIGRAFAPGSAAPKPVYAPNERLEQALPVALQPTERALVIAVDSRCAYCNKSMPFYKRLQEAHPANTKIVFVGKEQASTLRAYLTQHALQPEAIATVPRDFLKMSLTPFMLLVDANGRVLENWPGYLDESQESIVFRALAKTH
jgi:thioredoxin-related protein